MVDTTPRLHRRRYRRTRTLHPRLGSKDSTTKKQFAKKKNEPHLPPRDNTRKLLCRNSRRPSTGHTHGSATRANTTDTSPAGRIPGRLLHLQHRQHGHRTASSRRPPPSGNQLSTSNLHGSIPAIHPDPHRHKLANLLGGKTIPRVSETITRLHQPQLSLTRRKSILKKLKNTRSSFL